jgi:hypothetical protein
MSRLSSTIAALLVEPARGRAAALAAPTADGGALNPRRTDPALVLAPARVPPLRLVEDAALCSLIRSAPLNDVVGGRGFESRRPVVLRAAESSA